jgi:hypothetical protein
MPAGTASFEDILDRDYFFVDKTHMLLPLYRRNKKCLLIVAPRRMGKSMWISIIKTFFSKHHTKDRKNIF